MIRALVTGSLYGPPQARTSQAGKQYVTAKVRAWRINKLNEVIAKAAEHLPEPPEPPDDLAEQIRARLAEHPAMRWDAALMETAP